MELARQSVLTTHFSPSMHTPALPQTYIHAGRTIDIHQVNGDYIAYETSPDGLVGVPIAKSSLSENDLREKVTAFFSVSAPSLN